MKRTVIGISAALLAACNQQTAQNQPVANAPEPAVVNEPAPAPQANATLPDDRTPLAEPKGPIDPKSAEAAGQVVQNYGALIERGRWLKAEKLWGDIDAARTLATTLGGRFGQVHLEIGKLGETEGAAGSIYLTEPVVFYGTSKGGKDFRLPADVVLRRVNDVPGSTEAQRRWHIEQIDLKNPA
ncbi:MAG TPA: hypothetical protein VKC17_04125 [Sphingomicrobium sp.]|nr:hypothetical protein [Sphingomicrobium sp.]